MKTIGIIVGSLRKNSYNKHIAEFLVSQFPAEYSVKMIDISNLPLYNEDLDTKTPPNEWVRFREEIKNTNSFIFVTPEYNRSIPAVLKNALDVGSRPPTQGVWQGKPGAIISASPGAIGGFGANHHLRQTAVFLDMFIMAQPEAYLGRIADAFDSDGHLKGEWTISFLKKFVGEYVTWIKKFE